MNHSLRRFLPMILVLLPFALAIGEIEADDRTWLKYHQVVAFDDEVMAEFTWIETSDNISPSKVRALYQDEEGVRLVLRYESGFIMNGGIRVAQSSHITITKLDNSEALVIDLANGQVTVGIGSESLTFEDADDLPASVKQAGLRVVANASQGFRDALRRLTEVGATYAPKYRSVALIMRQLFFQDVSALSEADYESDPVGIVRNFNPGFAAAGPFEQPFGAAYDE